MAAPSKTPKTPTAATSVAGWKNKRQASGVLLELPSGNVVKVRPISIAEMISNKVLPDTLLPIVEQSIAKGQGKRPQDKKSKKGVEDEDLSLEKISEVAEMFDGVDQMIPKVVLEPEVHYHKAEIEEGEDGALEIIRPEARDDEVLYTDEMDLNDKMYIFQWLVGGTTDLESFRAESGQLLDGVQ